MKRFIAAVLLSFYVVVACFGAAQGVVVEVPECKPTLAMVVSTLADYDVRHQPTIEGVEGEYWGLTIPAKKLILISEAPAHNVRVRVVLHELVHVCYRNIGFEMPREVEDRFAEQQAQELYKELFGK
jgi:hypothetical protein